jgi:hypothetical protein
VADDQQHVATHNLDKRAAFIRAAEEHGLLGPKDCTLGGRFSKTLIEQAKRVSGIPETTELLTYALIKLALEDDFGDRLLARKGRVPKGMFFAS